MAFSQKRITVQFDLANGEFEGGGNSAEVAGLRVSCNIVNCGQGSGQAEISIWGLPLALMNQLSTVGSQYLQMNKNHISVLAGDDETGQNVVVVGENKVGKSNFIRALQLILDPGLSERDRQLGLEHFWDGLGEDKLGETIEIAVELTDFTDDARLMAHLNDCVVDPGLVAQDRADLVVAQRTQGHLLAA